MPPVALLPMLIEIKQQIDPSVQLEVGMPVKVGMDLQKTPARYLMQTPAADIRVGNQSHDAGERAQVFQKRLRVQVVDQVPGDGPEPVLSPRRKLQLLRII